VISGPNEELKFFSAIISIQITIKSSTGYKIKGSTLRGAAFFFEQALVV
jgi:hypothetical protein